MEQPTSATGSPRRPGRNVAHSVPQHLTSGPLEAADDPLSQNDTQRTPVRVATPQEQLRSTPPQRQSIPSTQRPSNEARSAINLKFLQNPDIYHRLDAVTIPSAFRQSSYSPSADDNLETLVENGHFGQAADLALRTIIYTPHAETEQLYNALYIRLSCLVLVNQAEVAAQEAIPLTDFLSRSPEPVLNTVPWKLRLLLVRLQSIGAIDGGRRGIMSLYALAGEVRSRIRAARNGATDEDITLWTTRLRDLGLRVCDALVGMGELETATRHLDSLTDVDAAERAYRKALLRARVGDVVGARECVGDIESTTRRQTLEALLHVAEGDFESALAGWQQLKDGSPDDEMFAQNAAIAMLYTGQITPARTVLEDMMDHAPTFPSLLFNLGTVYELCSARAGEFKTQMSRRAAAKAPGPECGGWERQNYEFKL